MQIKRRRSIKKFIPDKRARINERIRAPQVRLIDAQGNNLGVMATPEALDKARQAGLDLIEVNPKVQPPVCKILDFGKFKYEKDKLAHKQKVASKKSEIKCIRLSFKIKGHDLDNRIKQAKKFLAANNQVKVELILKGREKAHAGHAREMLEKFINNMGEDIKIIQPTQRQGGKFSVVIGLK